MQRWSQRLHAVNKATGRRWSPIPKPPPQDFDRLCGTHSVLNTLRAFYLAPRRLHPHRRQLCSLYVRDFRLEASCNTKKNGDDDAEKSNDGHDVWIPKQYPNMQRIVRLARTLSVAVHPVERRELVRLCGERRNQNVVLEVSTFTPRDVVASPWESGRRVWDADGRGMTEGGVQTDDVVFLDHVIDPANVGAIMRSAFFMGLRRIVLSSDSAGCTAAVCRSSAGFMEYMSVYRAVVPTLTFLENTVAQQKARDDGHLLEIYATSPMPRRGVITCSARELPSVSCGPVNKPRRRLLLLGNEGAGLPSEVMGLCTHTAHIPLAPERSHFMSTAVDGGLVAGGNDRNTWRTRGEEAEDIAHLRPEEVSLNVSAASALILAALRRGDGAVEVYRNH